jgi:hypothetical protein
VTKANDPGLYGNDGERTGGRARAMPMHGPSVRGFVDCLIFLGEGALGEVFNPSVGVSVQLDHGTYALR